MEDPRASLQAAQGIRSGKFRHIYGEPLKPHKQFLDIKKPLTSGESSYITANDKFFALPKASGGGPVYIVPLNKPGRMKASHPVLSVQKGKILDMDFHPFISNMISTVSEDTSVAVSRFPKEGLTESIYKPLMLMKGHGKKVSLCQFNPVANGILASGSYDRTVKLWNIEKGECLKTFNKMKDNIYSLEWNQNGSQIACSSKDKNLYIFDPRSIEQDNSFMKTQAFDGSKSSKVFWMSNLGWIGATGFTKTAKRQIRFWDLKNLSKPIFSTNIDASASVMMPHFDSDNGVLFTYGKGDGVISWYECINDSKKLYPLGQYRSNKPQKGGAFVPKRGLDVWNCEIGKFLKLTSNSVIPVPLVVPRKAGRDVFQYDIFPDTYAGKPALTADEYMSGGNAEPVLMSLNPEQREKDSDSDVEIKFEKKKSYDELEAENKQLKKEIEQLKLKVTKLEEQ